MAKITTNQVSSAYQAACLHHGESEAAKDMARILLIEIRDQEQRFAASSERKAREAEEELTSIVGEIPSDAETVDIDDVANLFTDDAA